LKNHGEQGEAQEVVKADVEE